jgi:hypothetical protein
MANIKTEIRRRRLRQQQKHTNQILVFILREKNNRKQPPTKEIKDNLLPFKALNSKVATVIAHKP